LDAAECIETEDASLEISIEARVSLLEFLMEQNKSMLEIGTYRHCSDTWLCNFRNYIKDCAMVHPSVVTKQPGKDNVSTVGIYLKELPWEYQRLSEAMHRSTGAAGQTAGQKTLCEAAAACEDITNASDIPAAIDDDSNSAVTDDPPYDLSAAATESREENITASNVNQTREVTSSAKKTTDKVSAVPLGRYFAPSAAIPSVRNAAEPTIREPTCPPGAQVLLPRGNC
jgi:hypothetical protein